MQTATVFGTDTVTRVTAFLSRISQTAFIDNKSPLLSDLANRIQDISELSLNSGAEWWQVINYSPGGFYVVHSDAFSAVGFSLWKILHIFSDDDKWYFRFRIPKK